MGSYVDLSDLLTAQKQQCDTLVRQKEKVVSGLKIVAIKTIMMLMTRTRMIFDDDDIDHFVCDDLVATKEF